MTTPRWLLLGFCLCSAGCEMAPGSLEPSDASVDRPDALEDGAVATAAVPPALGNDPAEVPSMEPIAVTSLGIAEPSGAATPTLAPTLVALARPVGPPTWPARTTRLGAHPRSSLTDLVGACRGARFDSVTAVAARPGVLVAWNARHIAWSPDDGRTWQEVLSAPGRVSDVSLDDDGTVYAMRSARALWARSPEGAVRRVRIARARRTIGFAAGGGRLAWFGTTDDLPRDTSVSTLFYSDDHGRTWQVPDDVFVIEGNFQNRVEVLPDRTVIASAATELSCGGGARWSWRVRPDGRFDELQRTLDPFLLGGFGAHGATYSLDWSCQHGRTTDQLCASALDRTENVSLLDLGYESDADVTVVSNRERTLAVVGGKLYELTPERATLVSDGVPFALAAVDAYGRAVGLVDGRVVRRDDDGVWNVLCGG